MKSLRQKEVVVFGLGQWRSLISPSPVWNVMVDPVHGGAEDLVLGIDSENKKIVKVATIENCRVGNLRYSLEMNWQRRSVSISKNSSSPRTENIVKMKVQFKLVRMEFINLSNSSWINLILEWARQAFIFLLICFAIWRFRLEADVDSDLR